jgi:hypothetical protein
MKKKIFSVIAVLTIALAMLSGCGSGAAEEAISDKSNDIGEGIGSVVPPTEDEIRYILSLNTKSWLDLDQAKQDEAISLIVRWWESVDGYVDPDLDLFKQDLNHQMETYARNNTDIGLFATACDIRNIDPGKYVKG